MNNKHLRQIISLLLLVVFCVSLFSGCSTEVPEGSSQASLDSTGGSSVATKATESTYATVSSSSGVTLVDPGPVAPMDDTPRVVNGVYATCQNYNFAKYSWGGKRQSFPFI